jgi:hypothetical protein
LRRIVVCACAVVSLAAGAHAAGAAASSPERTSRILFPETSGWRAFDSLPVPDAAVLEREKSRLRSIYDETPQDLLMERAECSFITRALDEHFDIGRFRSLDVDGDGNPDVVYSGDAECSEGDVTVIWFGDARGGLAKRNVTIIPLRLLRLEPVGRRRFSSVKVGCCASAVDEYFMGDMRNPRLFARLRMFKRLVLPDGMVTASGAFVADGETVVRTSPVVNDEYDPNMSRAMVHAVFGTVAARYLAGAKGAIVASYTDSAGTAWRLIVFDEASRALRLESPYGTDAGWVRID